LFQHLPKHVFCFAKRVDIGMVKYIDVKLKNLVYDGAGLVDIVLGGGAIIPASSKAHAAVN
jgi:uridylate kinase